MKSATCQFFERRNGSWESNKLGTWSKRLRATSRYERKLMRKNVIRIALCAMFFAVRLPADAQQPAKVAKIGYLSPGGTDAGG